MTYKIADLKVNIPDIGNLKARAKAYEVTCPDEITCSDEVTCLDKVTCPDKNKDLDKYDIYLDEEKILNQIAENNILKRNSDIYMLSGDMFYRQLLKYDGMMLHASAVKFDGKAYLFSGPCGIGKTTHTRLWKKNFPGAEVINDDKPALRLIDGMWIAYGTPWCGKDSINKNDSAPIAGICFLKKGDKNEIRKLEPIESIPLFIGQTVRSLGPKGMNKMLELLDDILRKVPVYELTSIADKDAAMLSKEVMMGK